MSPQLTATVSGSFRRAMGAVQEAVYSLTDAGVQVLSPADPRVVDQFGDFVFVASDRVRILKTVQDRHLAAIAASDFVWLVAPEGYIGQSGAMELGHAQAVGTPVYCSEVPADLTLRQYVTVLPGPQDAARATRDRQRDTRMRIESPHVLLDPVAAVRSAHEELDRIEVHLTRAGSATGHDAGAAVERLDNAITQPLRVR